jgi:CBS domain-containing protein
MQHDEPIRCLLQEKGSAVFTISPDTTVYDALAIMANREIGALIVMNGDRIEGIVSERDYARKVILQGRSSRETPVRDIMTSGLLSVGPAESVDECMRLMTENKVRHLPVISEGRLMGIVSLGDLVKWIITSQRDTIQHLHAYISGGYPS